MFGLDELVAGYSDGTSLGVLVLVAVVLGLRHATDPDHLAAVSTLIASGGERAPRRAARLGLSWGLGHATSLFAFGVPVVLYGAYLPAPAQRGAETVVGLVIVGLAVSLLLRWRRGAFHEHGTTRARSGREAYGIGLVHGMGGTAGVGILLLSAISSHILALAALAIFALGTAVSMAVASTGLGLTLGGPLHRSFERMAPALGFGSLAFGVWYALAAQGVVPYVF
jgi:High-affinity nickel-transport protein